ncbi:unnamed protein product [Musa hybrid cultivar]
MIQSTDTDLVESFCRQNLLSGGDEEVEVDDDFVDVVVRVLWSFICRPIDAVHERQVLIQLGIDHVHQRIVSCILRRLEDSLGSQSGMRPFHQAQRHRAELGSLPQEEIATALEDCYVRRNLHRLRHAEITSMDHVEQSFVQHTDHELVEERTMRHTSGTEEEKGAMYGNAGIMSED